MHYIEAIRKCQSILNTSDNTNYNKANSLPSVSFSNKYHAFKKMKLIMVDKFSTPSTIPTISLLSIYMHVHTL